ncbi:MAG: M23 family metallopeptidase [Rikenellaceae bacterium]|jgi:hypothetical protein|nr:M23 family metallopeptidase [Rikenellaceae bacterium]
MPKKQYRFNPQSLTYELVKAPTKVRFYRIVRKLIVGFILASLFNFGFSYFFHTPKMYRLHRDSRELTMKYRLLEEKIASSTRRAEEIKHRDQLVYRSLFGADVMDIDEPWLTLSEERYSDMPGGACAPLVAGGWRNEDRLARMIYVESVSFDQLQALARDKEKMAVSIPAIWPIDKRFLRTRIGAFGWRNHPILGRYQMHTGIDLGSSIGVKVYATGDGRVVLDPGHGSGYGLQVFVDHGFGYKTRYAHLSKVLVVPGQEVRRGEVVGEVGSTGRSTGPHLHYEVIYRGTPVDPINYFRKDMSEDELRTIIAEATATTFEN